MSTTPTALLDTVAQLQRENKQLRDRESRRKSERRRLRMLRLIDRAHLDALALVTVAIGGGCVWRQYSPLPQRRWAYAAGLLKLAGVTSRHHELRIIIESEGDVIAKIDHAAQVAKDDPSKYVRHLPPFVVPDVLQPLRRT